jgi:hypothetical protein
MTTGTCLASSGISTGRICIGSAAWILLSRLLFRKNRLASNNMNSIMQSSTRRIDISEYSFLVPRSGTERVTKRLQSTYQTSFDPLCLDSQLRSRYTVRFRARRLSYQSSLPFRHLMKGCLGDACLGMSYYSQLSSRIASSMARDPCELCRWYSISGYDEWFMIFKDWEA